MTSIVRKIRKRETCNKSNMAMVKYAIIVQGRYRYRYTGNEVDQGTVKHKDYRITRTKDSESAYLGSRRTRTDQRVS
jgi:hypothetical protein